LCASNLNKIDYKAHINKQRNQLITSFYDLPFRRLLHHGEISWTSDEDFVNEAILKAYKKAVYTRKGYYDSPWEKQYLMGVIEDIKKTDLYRFLEMMPKGAILHLHPSSMGDYRFLIEKAAAQSWDGKTYWVDLEKKSIELNRKSPGDTYISLREVLDDPELSKQFTTWFTLSKEELNQENGKVPWKDFKEKFKKVEMLLEPTNTQLYYHYFYNAFHHLLNTDNIMHIELRTSWIVENERKEGTKESIILKALDDVNREYDSNNKLTIKTIWSDSRSFNKKRQNTIIEDIIYVGNQLKNPENSYLIGYDLVSEGYSSEQSYYKLDDISSVCSQLGGYLPPIFWHDGESELPPDYEPYHQNGSNCPRNDCFSNNLIDAYLLNNPPCNHQVGRVGHGTELFKIPKLLEKYCELGLPVELCPVSSQYLKGIRNLRVHPGQSYLAEGLPVSLNSDDPAIYDYQGVTVDFWEACIAWNLDLKMLKILSYYSLKYSGLSAIEKKKAIPVWEQSWNNFIKQQIAETIP